MRKEKDAVKAASKREKKLLRSLCVDRFDHFIEPSKSSNPAASPDDIKIRTLQNMELLCTALSHLELGELNKRLEAAADPQASFEVWQQEISRVRKATEAPGLRPDTKTENGANGPGGSSSSKSKWTFEMSQILIKAVNLFPAGTQKRLVVNLWEVIAAYVNQHAKGATVTGKEALKQAKDLQKDDGTMKQETNLKAFDNFASHVKDSEATKSVTITDKLEAGEFRRCLPTLVSLDKLTLISQMSYPSPSYPGVSAHTGCRFMCLFHYACLYHSICFLTFLVLADSVRPWTVSEQRSLERALRQYPQVPGEPPAERWQRIADFVGTRTR
ncbi:unnamed protein product, partial [Dibothriocephalus latus]